MRFGLIEILVAVAAVVLVPPAVALLILAAWLALAGEALDGGAILLVAALLLLPVWALRRWLRWGAVWRVWLVVFLINIAIVVIRGGWPLWGLW